MTLRPTQSALAAALLARSAPILSAQAVGYRELTTVDRDQVFAVQERGTREYWFKIELEDGTSGWILGDLVFPFDVGEAGKPGVFRRMGRAIKRALLGPSPAPYAHVGMSFSAGILDGDYALIKRQDVARDGEIVVALIEDSEATLKFFRREGAMVRLDPANRAYDPQRYTPSQVRVQGKLAGLLRRYD